MNRPLAIDLFCGLGGWTDGLLAEGYAVVGFDIEDHGYEGNRYAGELVLQDVRTLHGAWFKGAALIVASPPCQEYSYMAMPWSRAKEKARLIKEDTTGQKLADLTRLFNECFRIQREASFAAGRHIPMVVENVRGAQPWIGKARGRFGSFYLWGDVPENLPLTVKNKVPGFRFDGSGRSFQSAAVRHTAIKVPTLDGRKSDGGSWFGNYALMKEGIKQRGSGREWFAGDGKISRLTSSKSPARKRASALIAKIPLPLSRHVAATFKTLH